MTNAGHIFIPSDKRVAKERHLHRCPMKWCGKMIEEGNEVCQKQLHGTGLEYHVFPCSADLHVWREQWGLDGILDVWLDVKQAQRFTHEWPDAKVAQRESTEAATNPDIAAIRKEPT